MTGASQAAHTQAGLASPAPEDRGAQVAVREPLKLFWLSDGTTAHTVRWVRKLAERGHDVLLFSLAAPDDAQFGDIRGLRVETLGLPPSVTYATDGSARKARYLRALPMIRRLHRAFAPDLCHAHYVSSYGVLAMLARLRPLVTSIWGADVYATPERSFLHRWIIERALAYPDCVLSTSWVMREQGLALGRERISVVPFGIDVERFSPANEGPPPSGPVTIGTVKSLEPKYGIDVLLKAFADVKRSRPAVDLRLLIVGKGTQREELVRLAGTLDLTDCVDFAGPVEYEAVHELHRTLDIAVFPSVEESESFGVAAVEAQACGVAVIVSRVGGLPEVVEEGRTALVVPARDEAALAEAIRTLLDDAELRSAFGECGRRRVLEHYDLDRCVELLETHYASVLRTGR